MARALAWHARGRQFKAGTVHLFQENKKAKKQKTKKETTLLAILQSMLVHGMIVCGDPISSGGHYGAACHKFDERAKKECYGLGKRVAELTKKLSRE